jgi:peptidoglycan hydrolase-like protein with peptidoglycan-binding domain
MTTPNPDMTHEEWLEDVKQPGPNGQTFFHLATHAVVGTAAGNFIMEDNVTPSLFTPGCAAYAGYANGTFANMPAVTAYAATQKAKVFSFTPYVASNADALDIEPGDAVPADAPAGYKAGLRYFYGSASSIPAIVSALAGAGIPRTAYKIIAAHYIGPHICGPSTCGYDLADATQFTDSYLGASLDASLCPPDFFTAPSSFPILPGATGPQVLQLQQMLNKWAKPIKLTTPLALDSDFGPATKAAVILAQQYFGEHGITAGNVTQSLFTKLEGNPPAPPAPPVYGPPLKLGVSAATVTITWAAPAPVAGVAAVTGYVVNLLDSTKKSVTGFPTTLPATQTSVTVQLPRGQSFTFSVAAKSANGTGKPASGPFSV